MKYYTKRNLFNKTLVFLFIYAQAFAQSYTTETIKLWEGEKTPFNKENITLNETLDKAGIRYSKISEPLMFVYKNSSIRKNGSALLIFPGGGYSQVSIGSNNGEAMAKRFLEMGFNVVCVIKYRLPDARIVNSQDKVPLCDAQKSLSIIHRKTANWSLDRNKIAVIGFSAGGHLAASLANLKDDIHAPNVKPKELKQAVSILLYPVISFNLPFRNKASFKNLLGDKSENQLLLDYYSMENQVSKNTPKTYIVHAIDDVGVTIENSVIYCESLKQHNVKYKYVPLEKGGHGFGIGINKTGVDWTIGLEEWLRTQTNLFND